MTEYLNHLKKSKRYLHIADHMLTQTYPLIKDPKLFVAIMDNVFLCLSSSLDALVFYERELKEIPPFHNSFESKFNVFKLKLMSKYSIDVSFLKFIEDIKNIILKHRESPVEFARNDKFVICSEEYDLTSISIDSMKKFIKQSKLFLELVNKIVGE